MSKQLNTAVLNAILAKVLANPAVLAQLANGPVKATKQAKPADEAKTPNADFAAAVKRIFTDAGFQDVRPNETVLTWDRWEAKGFKVREDQRKNYLRIQKKGNGYAKAPQGPGHKGIRLYHASQVEPMQATA